LVLSAAIRKKKSNSLVGVLFWLTVAIAGSCLALLIPPMQSPDENQHIARAYLISQGTVTLSAPQGKMSGGNIDRALAAFLDTYFNQAIKPGDLLSAEKKKQLDTAVWAADGTKTFMQISGTGYYLPLIYLPHAVGLKAGQVLGLSIGKSYLLCRLTVFLTCLGLLAASFRLVRPSTATIAVLLLPMSLFQLVLPTLDGLTVCLTVLLVSILHCRLKSGKCCNWWDSLGLACGIVVLATSRTHLLPLLALPFYLYWRQRDKRDILNGLFATAFSFVWIIYAIQSTVDLRISRTCTTTSLIAYYLGHPLEYFRVVFASLANDAVRDFYAKSFVGILGWLNIPLASTYYPVLWGCLAACILVSFSLPTGREDRNIRFVLCLISLISGALIFFALLVTWTPYPATVVIGVQGRYFTIPVLLLGYAASGLQPAVSRYRRWFSWVFGVLMAIISLVALFQALLARYGSL
jgi:uncharacterized membrane protein